MPLDLVDNVSLDPGDGEGFSPKTKKNACTLWPFIVLLCPLSFV